MYVIMYEQTTIIHMSADMFLLYMHTHLRKQIATQVAATLGTHINMNAYTATPSLRFIMLIDNLNICSMHSAAQCMQKQNRFPPPTSS